ncbi:MAG: hypothetical protein ACFE8B_01305 [Candidatus Hermodarchaeota archaeon]
MKEEEVEPINEKEEKRKIKVVSQIDDLLAIQGQNYMKGLLKEALVLADQIIELAESENLESFIKEQKDLIARIEGIFKRREAQKREKFENQLKSELAILENEFKKALKTENFSNIDQIINDAKKLLFELEDEGTNLKWRKFENEYLDSIAKKEIIEEVLKLIKERSELITNFQFEDLKLRLTYLIEQLQDKDINDYLQKLKEIEQEVIKAEETYKNTQIKIKDISKRISSLRESKELQLAIQNCKELIGLAKSINEDNSVKLYSEILIEIEADLEFESLKELIKKLNDQGLNSLKNGSIQTSIEKFKQIQETLQKYVE